MTVCHYFLQGRCRYGQNCRFEHSYINDERSNKSAVNAVQLSNVIKQIVSEVILAEKGGQWPLSCYSPAKEGPNIPGWEDVSPEEVRWKMYEARANGTLNQCINEINQLYSNAEKQRNLLKQPTMERINLIVNMLKGQKDSTSSVNPFVSSSKSANIFGGSSQTQTTNTQGNIFSKVIQPTGSSSSIFRGSPQLSGTQGSIFGGTPQTPGNQVSIFGGTSNFGSQNVFGGSNSSNTLHQNIFTNPSPVSSGNIFLNAATASQNIFSSGQSLTQMNNQTIAPNAVSSQNTGIYSNQASSAPLFGSFQNSGNKPTTQVNIFGQPQSESIFKSQTSFSKDENIFNTQQTTTNNIFESQSSSKPMDSSVYSKIEDLSESEINSFKAPTFVFGKIPLKPPPKEFCK